jgi:hypothetical protein
MSSSRYVNRESVLSALRAVLIAHSFLLLSKMPATAPLYRAVVAMSLIVSASSPRERGSGSAEVGRNASETGRRVHA